MILNQIRENMVDLGTDGGINCIVEKYVEKSGFPYPPFGTALVQLTGSGWEADLTCPFRPLIYSRVRRSENIFREKTKKRKEVWNT